MTGNTLSPSLTIGFAHAAYQLRDEFLTRNRKAQSFEVRSLSELERRVGEADILVVSGLWRNELVRRAPKLRLVQSISAGTDQFSKAMLSARGIKLASAQGANEIAVAEHAMSLMLALTRQLHFARDHQAKHYWLELTSIDRFCLQEEDSVPVRTRKCSRRLPDREGRLRRLLASVERDARHRRHRARGRGHLKSAGSAGRRTRT